jgi:hypothetical protein
MFKKQHGTLIAVAMVVVLRACAVHWICIQCSVGIRRDRGQKSDQGP